VQRGRRNRNRSEFLELFRLARRTLANRVAVAIRTSCRRPRRDAPAIAGFRKSRGGGLMEERARWRFYARRKSDSHD
jgi:hypothetical protein